MAIWRAARDPSSGTRKTGEPPNAPALLIAMGAILQLNLWPMRRPFFISLLLAGITLGLYWPAASFEAVCYDDSFFLNAPEVQSGVNAHSLLWALTNADMANWHPVTSLSFVLTHQFFGNNAGAEHLVNVVIHALNAGLLFLVLWQLTSRRSAAPGPQAEMRWRCAAVAALFAWHPLRVESVAWIAERKDVLCGFFMLLTLWAYTRYAELAKLQSPKSKIIFGCSLLAFALGLMSKAMLVTVPFLLLLLDVWPLNRIPKSEFRSENLRRLIFEKVPFLALTAIFCVVTFQVQRGENATPSLAQLGLGLRLENVIVSYLRYLGWTLWPANLAVYYSFPYDSHFYLALWPDWQIGAGFLLLAGVSWLCIRQIFSRPYLAVGWFWYLGTLVPVIGLVQVGSQGMADRYTYIPLIGPAISVVWLLAEAWGKGTFRKATLTIIATSGLAASLWQTRHQLAFWKNSDTLFQHAIDVTGENPRAEYLLGLSLEHQGRNAEAMAHYRNAISSQPRVKEAFCALGRLFGQQGEWTRATAAYLKLLEDNPEDFNAHLGLVVALPHLGQTAEAAMHLSRAIELCPSTAEDMNNLAWTLAVNPEASLRDGSRAVELARRACELTGYRETIMVGTLGAAYAEAGRFDEAITTAQAACALAEKSGAEQLLEINRHLLEQYRQHQPYREPENPVPSNPPQ